MVCEIHVGRNSNNTISELCYLIGRAQETERSEDSDWNAYLRFGLLALIIMCYLSFDRRESDF